MCDVNPDAQALALLFGAFTLQPVTGHRLGWAALLRASKARAA